jgi:hypothetical protein
MTSAEQNDSTGAGGRTNLRQLIRTTIRSKFPLAPVGTHPATCIDIEIADSTFANAQPGDKVIRLTWEITMPTKEHGGLSRKYTVHAKPLGVYFSTGSALVQLLKALTGNDAAYTTVDHDEDGNAVIDFDASVFVGMRCTLAVVHVEQFQKTYANIAEYQTDDAQKAENSKRLPA